MYCVDTKITHCKKMLGCVEYAIFSCQFVHFKYSLKTICAYLKA